MRRSPRSSSSCPSSTASPPSATAATSASPTAAWSSPACPKPALPEICAAYRRLSVEAPLREALCGARTSSSPARVASQLPPALALKIERARRAFVLPLHDAESRVAALRRQAQDGSDELRDNADQVAAVEAEIAPYVDRFRLAAGDAGGPAPLRCASEWTAAALATRPAAAGLACRRRCGGSDDARERRPAARRGARRPRRHRRARRRGAPAGRGRRAPAARGRSKRSPAAPR